MRTGHGKEALRFEGGSLKRTEAGACQSKASGTASPPMGLCWECQAGGVRVAACGQQRNHRWALERRNEVHCPTAKETDLWMLIWEEVQKRGMRQDVDHVQAHHSKKETQELSLFE